MTWDTKWRAALFEGLDHVLALADVLPSGDSRDTVRRSVCELIEANSDAERRVRLRTLLSVIDRLERRHARERTRIGDATATAIQQLLTALRHRVVPILADQRPS